VNERTDATGLRDDDPRVTALGAITGLGAGWGLLGYSVLWEGTPFQVQRPFVTSVIGTLVLLPVRVVIWGIHLAEVMAGRSFDLSQNHWWIALAASTLGAGALAGVYGLARWVRRRLQAFASERWIPS
jgi:hypothetical protein